MSTINYRKPKTRHWNMVKQMAIRLCVYIRREIRTLFGHKGMQTSKERPSSTGYGVAKPVFKTRLDEITLQEFINCAVEHDYSSLIVKGAPTDEEVAQNWLVIISEYYKVSGNTQIQRYVATNRKHSDMLVKWRRVSANVQGMRAALPFLEYVADRAAELATELRNDGYRYAYTAKSLPTDLTAIETSIKRLELEMQKLEAELERMAEKKGSGSVTAEGFYSTLLDINKHNGVAYKAGDINMMQYCIMVRRLEEYIEQLKKSNK